MKKFISVLGLLLLDLAIIVWAFEHAERSSWSGLLFTAAGVLLAQPVIGGIIGLILEEPPETEK